VSGDTLNDSGELSYGDMKLLPLGIGERAEITVDPARGFDLGAGPGKRVQRTVHGGTVGLILDARGRPLQLPEDRATCRQTIAGWIESIDLYPAPEAAAVAVA
jgi:hypothetical protein